MEKLLSTLFLKKFTFSMSTSSMKITLPCILNLLALSNLYSLLPLPFLKFSHQFLLFLQLHQNESLLLLKKKTSQTLLQQTLVATFSLSLLANQSLSLTNH